MDKKRLVIIILFLLFTVLVGLLIYRVFFGDDGRVVRRIDDPTTTGTPGAFPSADDADRDREVPTEPGELPLSVDFDFGFDTQEPALRNRREALEPRITRAVPTQAVSPGVDSRGNLRYYDEQDGKFYRYTADGRVEPLNSQVFYNASDVTWSPTTDESIIEYPDGSNIYFDFKTSRQVTLPRHWEEFSFSADGNKVAAKSLGLSPDNRWLLTSDPDGKNVRLIEPLGENANKVIVDWSPNQQVVAFSRTGAALGADAQEVLLVGQNKENFVSLEVDGRDFRQQWSPQGDQLLYSVFNARTGFRPELWITDASGNAIGQNRRTIGIATWADKCAFSTERFVYCAVPQELEIGTGFAPQLADSTPDEFFRIDLQTGIKTKIDTEGFHIVEKLFTSDDGRTLYFQDKIQAGIFSVDL